MRLERLLFLSSFLLEGVLVYAAASPGIGYELECRNLKFQQRSGSGTEKMSKANSAQLKGKPWIFPDAPNNYPDWKLTAEVEGDTYMIGEIVVSGPANKGVTMTSTSQNGRTIAREIETWLDQAQPAVGRTVQVKGFETAFGDWDITSPQQYSALANCEWGVQVTAPVPLAALQHLFKYDEDDGTVTSNTPLVSKTQAKKYHLMHNSEMGYYGNMEDTSGPQAPRYFHGSEDVLGFFTLIMAYIKNSHSARGDHGAKHATPIMPRTDFRTIYHQVRSEIEEWVDRIEKHGDYNTVGKKAGYGKGTGIVTDFYSLTENICFTVGICSGGLGLDTKYFEWGQHRVTVKDWIRDLGSHTATGKDKVSQADQDYRQAQIGGLGSKMETQIGGTKALPIFEFRDIEGIKVAQFSQKMQAWENDVRNAHRYAHAQVQNEMNAYRKRSVSTKATTSKTATSGGGSTSIQKFLKEHSVCPKGMHFVTKKDPKLHGETYRECVCASGQKVQAKKNAKTGEYTYTCTKQCAKGQKMTKTKDPKTGKVVEKCTTSCEGGTLKKTTDPKTHQVTEKCECKKGATLKDGKCVADTCNGGTLKKTTNPKTKQVTEKCVCPKGKTLKNGNTCVATSSCKGGTMKTVKGANGKTTQKCSCPKGTTLKAGTCTKSTTKCTKNEVLKNDKCVKKTTTTKCPTGQTLKNGKCVKKTTTTKCPKGAVLKGGKCQRIKCPSGSTLKGTKCMRVKCPSGAVEKNGKCVKIKCPKGAVLKGSTCRKITCPRGSQLRGTKCQKLSCPKGSVLKGTKCQKTKKAPRRCPSGSKKVGNQCVSTKKGAKSKIKCQKMKNLKKKAACEAASGAVSLF